MGNFNSLTHEICPKDIKILQCVSVQNINNVQDMQDKATEIERSRNDVCKSISTNVKNKFYNTLDDVQKESSDILSKIIALESEIAALTRGKLKRGDYECIDTQQFESLFFYHIKKILQSVSISCFSKWRLLSAGDGLELSGH